MQDYKKIDLAITLIPGNTGHTGNHKESNSQRAKRFSSRKRFLWIIALLAEVANSNRALAVERSGGTNQVF
jgi:hypothetical protein